LVHGLNCIITIKLLEKFEIIRTFSPFAVFFTYCGKEKSFKETLTQKSKWGHAFLNPQTRTADLFKHFLIVPYNSYDF
jgi:hypothetical protein